MTRWFMKWSDVDWLNCTLRVERSIVRQRVGDVKTVYSGRGRDTRCAESLETDHTVLPSNHDKIEATSLATLRTVSLRPQRMHRVHDRRFPRWHVGRNARNDKN